MAAVKKTKVSFTNSEGWKESPWILRDSWAPKVVSPTMQTTSSKSRPAIPYTQAPRLSCHTWSMIQGTIQVITAEATMTANCRTALSKEILVSMIRPTHSSMQALFTRSRDTLR